MTPPRWVMSLRKKGYSIRIKESQNRTIRKRPKALLPGTSVMMTKMMEPVNMMEPVKMRELAKMTELLSVKVKTVTRTLKEAPVNRRKKKIRTVK